MQQFINDCDQTFVIDNEAVYNLLHNVLRVKEPRYMNLNWVISQVMSNVTASFRFPCKGLQLNTTLKRLGINLVPFPRLHFLLVSSAPVFVAGGDKIRLSL